MVHNMWLSLVCILDDEAAGGALMAVTTGKCPSVGLPVLLSTLRQLSQEEAIKLRGFY